MTTKTLLAALDAVQTALRAEVAAQQAYQEERSPAAQVLWAAARMQTDRAWAALWELNRERVPQPALSGEEWARAMRAHAFDAVSGSTSSSGGVAA